MNRAIIVYQPSVIQRYYGNTISDYQDQDQDVRREQQEPATIGEDGMEVE